VYTSAVLSSPPFQAILQDLRQRKTGNPATDLLVSLLLALLAGFFTRLADLIERIRSGELQLRPTAPRQPPASQPPASQPPASQPPASQSPASRQSRQRAPRSGSFRWPAAMRPGPAEPPGHQPAPLPRVPPPAAFPAAARCAGTTRRRVRSASPAPPQKSCPKPAPWHAVIVTISQQKPSAG
jgi:hypothetical protein